MKKVKVMLTAIAVLVLVNLGLGFKTKGILTIYQRSGTTCIPISHLANAQTTFDADYTPIENATFTFVTPDECNSVLYVGIEI